MLRPGGVIAMIEPWLTPPSYLLYRFLHHEDCTLRINIQSPFQNSHKNVFDGNAGIPYNLVRHHSHNPMRSLQLTRAQPIVGLPYLATLGFKRSRPMSPHVMTVSRAGEKILGPFGRWNATRRAPGMGETGISQDAPRCPCDGMECVLAKTDLN